MESLLKRYAHSYTENIMSTLTLCRFSSNWVFAVWLASLKQENPTVAVMCGLVKHFINKHCVVKTLF